MKKKSYRIIAGVLAAVLVLTGFGWLYYNYVLTQAGITSTDDPKEYKWHYVMITSDSNSAMWQAVYESAAKEASAHDAYLEYLKNESTGSYTTEDFMKIAIASRVDGILVEGDGSNVLKTDIDAANEAGIPVVTMMQDSSDSKRVSFVGVNDYELGTAYGTEVTKIVTDSTKNILTLLDKNRNQEETSLMYTQMKDTVMANLGTPPIAYVNSEEIDTANTFDAEEDIRNIVTSDAPPDMLVCLDMTNTESAYQALIDYNRVGKIALVGYYKSDTIFSGIRNDIISFTISVNASELGRKCIGALSEYKTAGYVSNYISVELEIINKDNVDQYDMTQDTESGEDSIA